MLDIYTVTFFGHRYIDDPYTIEKSLEKYIRCLIDRKEYVDFLVGRNGDFDRCVSSAVRRVQKNYRDDNSSLCLVLPYSTAEYLNNQNYFERYYGEIEILDTKAHPKAAIGARNRQMADRADMIICYIKNKNGGAYQSVRYAAEQNKKIINLAEADDIKKFIKLINT